VFRKMFSKKKSPYLTETGVMSDRCRNPGHEFFISNISEIPEQNDLSLESYFNPSDIVKTEKNEMIAKKNEMIAKKNSIFSTFRLPEISSSRNSIIEEPTTIVEEDAIEIGELYS